MKIAKKLLLVISYIIYLLSFVKRRKEIIFALSILHERTTAKAHSKLMRKFMEYAEIKEYKALNISVVTLQGEFQAIYKQ